MVIYLRIYVFWKCIQIKKYIINMQINKTKYFIIFIYIYNTGIWNQVQNPL